MNITVNVLSYLIMFVQGLFDRLFQNILKINRKKYVALICIFAVCFLLCLLFSVFIFDGAKAEEKEMLHKYYTVITIEEGDSLWDYATEYGQLGYDGRTDYIHEVQAINHLQNINKLVIGETIVLPYYSYEIL